MEQYHDKLEEIERKVDKMYTALLGNELSTNGGLIHTIAEHHQRLNALERVLHNTKWLIIGLSISSGIGLVKIFETLLKYI
jgi:Mg2+ and Co2+ transporter CorA